jgi:predicted nuclease of predicted toxin-antitoxin system
VKILLDECVPFKLRYALGDHHVYTVKMMGWSGIKNGELITLADEQFDLFITIDKNLSYQQNLKRLRMAVVLISVPNNKVDTILKRAPELVALITDMHGPGFHFI